MSQNAIPPFCDNEKGSITSERFTARDKCQLTIPLCNLGRRWSDWLRHFLSIEKYLAVKMENICHMTKRAFSLKSLPSATQFTIDNLQGVPRDLAESPIGSPMYES